MTTRSRNTTACPNVDVWYVLLPYVHRDVNYAESSALCSATSPFDENATWEKRRAEKACKSNGGRYPLLLWDKSSTLSATTTSRFIFRRRTLMSNTITLGVSTSNVNGLQKGVSSFTKSFRYVRKCKGSQAQKALKWAIPVGSPETTFEMKRMIVSIDQRCEAGEITAVRFRNSQFCRRCQIPQ